MTKILKQTYEEISVIQKFPIKSEEQLIEIDKEINAENRNQYVRYFIIFIINMNSCISSLSLDKSNEINARTSRGSQKLKMHPKRQCYHGLQCRRCSREEKF